MNKDKNLELLLKNASNKDKMMYINLYKLYKIINENFDGLSKDEIHKELKQMEKEIYESSDIKAKDKIDFEISRITKFIQKNKNNISKDLINDYSNLIFINKTNNDITYLRKEVVKLESKLDIETTFIDDSYNLYEEYILIKKK